MSRFADQTTYDLSGVQVPLPSVTVYVYSSDTGQLATLTADGGGALANPLTSDGFGNYYFNAAQGLYDLRYLVGGKTVLWKYGVAVGGFSAAYRAVAQDVVNTTPLTVNVSTGAAFSYPTRGGIIGITSTTIGQRVQLTEAGRVGWWELKAGNYAALVTADTYQGLYLPHATLATTAAAWVRDVTGQDYQASWWGVGTGVADNTPLLASAIAQLPAGGKLHLDGGTFPQTTSLGVIKGDFALLGKGYKTTKLVMAVGSGAIGNLGINGSNIRIDGIGFYTNSIHAFANNNPNVGLGAPNGTSAPLYQNWRVTNCWFEGGAIGLIASGSDDNNATLTRAKDVYVQGCVFVNDEMGCSIAACENVEVSDCRFEMIVSTQNGAGCCLRTWGSKNVKFTNCFGSANSEFGILISTMARTTGTGVIRLANEGVRIENCNFTNCLSEGVHVTECKGLLEILNSTFTADTASTALTYGIRFAAGFVAINGLLPICDKVKVKNVSCIGYAVGFDEEMTIRNLELQNFEVIGNSNVTAYPGGTICGLMAGGIVLLEILHCKFLMSDQHLGSRFRIATGNSAQKVRLIGNSLPEGGGINVSDVSAGGVLVDDYDNHDYRAGTFAANIAP
jgi:hypothetical protein